MAVYGYISKNNSKTIDRRLIYTLEWTYFRLATRRLQSAYVTVAVLKRIKYYLSYKFLIT